MNIGPVEIIVVLAIALLVFGPGRLPQMGRTLGRGLREFKNAASTAKEELGLSEVLDDVNAVKDDVLSATGVDEIKQSIAGVTSTIDDVKKSAGVDEITAGVGSVKAAMAFDPRKAAKGLVTGGKPSSGAREKVVAEGSDADARESASPAAADGVVTRDDDSPALPGRDGGSAEAGEAEAAAVHTPSSPDAAEAAVAEPPIDIGDSAVEDAETIGPYDDLVTPPIPVAQA